MSHTIALTTSHIKHPHVVFLGTVVFAFFVLLMAPLGAHAMTEEEQLNTMSRQIRMMQKVVALMADMSKAQTFPNDFAAVIRTTAEDYALTTADTATTSGSSVEAATEDRSRTASSTSHSKSKLKKIPKDQFGLAILLCRKITKDIPEGTCKEAVKTSYKELRRAIKEKGEIPNQTERHRMFLEILKENVSEYLKEGVKDRIERKEEHASSTASSTSNKHKERKAHIKAKTSHGSESTLEIEAEVIASSTSAMKEHAKDSKAERALKFKEKAKALKEKRHKKKEEKASTATP